MKQRLLRNIPWFYASVYWLISALLIVQVHPTDFDVLTKVAIVAVGSILPLVVGFVHPSERNGEITSLERIRIRWVPVLIVFFLLTLLPVLTVAFVEDLMLTIQTTFVLGGLVSGTSLHFFQVADTIRVLSLQQSLKGNKKRLDQIADKTTMSAECIAIGGAVYVISGILFGLPVLSMGSSISELMLKTVFVLAGGSFVIYGICQAAMHSQWYLLCECPQVTSEIMKL